VQLGPFVRLTFNRRFVVRWIVAGILFFIPVVNFLSLGYLWRTSGLSMVGGLGLPTWEHRSELWREGARLAYIVILYESVPCFLFSFGFLLLSFGDIVTNYLGWASQVLSAFIFVVCTFFIPFAFCVFVETTEVRQAFEFERIIMTVKRVVVRYSIGYALIGCAMYLASKLRSIPYFGIVLVSVLVFYVMLVSTYFFTQLFRKAIPTSLNHSSVSKNFLP
jgi:hypothetical protein